MASSSRRCPDEDLQKAMADLQDLVSRRPIPDEFKFPGDDEEEESSKKEENKEKEKKKKKKLYMLPPEDVWMLLSFECESFPETKTLDQLAKEEKGNWEDAKTGVSILQVFGRHYEDNIRATQEMMRHQLRTKGYVTYEATDDEEEEAAQQGARCGRGRRRHRPGVSKPAGGSVKKLN